MIVNGVGSQILTTSTINLNNNVRLPVFNLYFFDSFNDARAPESNWIYTGVISIPAGAQ